MSAIDYARDTQVSRTSDFMVGLICGTAVGAVAGLLMASKPGKQLRGELAESATRFRSRLNETYHHASDAVTEAVDKGREAYRNGRTTVDAIRSRFDAQRADGHF